MILVALTEFLILVIAASRAEGRLVITKALQGLKLTIFSTASYPSWVYFILELWTFKVDELNITSKIGKRKICGRKRIKQSRKIYCMEG